MREKEGAKDRERKKESKGERERLCCVMWCDEMVVMRWLEVVFGCL